MAFQLGSALRNAMAGEIQTAGGSTATLKIFSGAEPANCAAADPSGALATISLPATFLTSTAGVASLTGTWSTTGSGAGNAASFRIYNGSTCIAQGDVTATGGGGVMELVNINIAVSQPISITSCTFTMGGA